MFFYVANIECHDNFRVFVKKIVCAKMSKYPGFENVKIVKKCEKEEEEISLNVDCKDFNFENENFLDNVDDEVLYVDSTLKVKEDIQENQSDQKIEDSSLKFCKPLDCFGETPRRLNKQMTLPLCDMQQLSFYETFIISKDKNDDSIRNSLPVIPCIDNIDEVGSSSLIVEEMEDGNILIFMMQQIFDNDERKVSEILSGTSKDLKLIHEKRIERTCGKNKSKEVRKIYWN